MPQHMLLLIRSRELGWGDLRLTLRSVDDVRVVGEATSADQATELATTHQPDVIITAATVEGASVLPVLSRILHDCCPTSKVIVVAARFDPAEVVALVDIGITGYLLWSGLCRDVLRHCLAAVIAGDIMLGNRVVARAFIDALRGGARPRETAVRVTERERAVLQGLADGRTREEIGREEELSVRTVKRIIGELEVKLAAPNQFVLGVKAARLGLVR